MKNRIVTVSVLCLGLTGFVQAADPKPTAEQEAMMKQMAQMEKYAAPGEEHKRLEPMVGKFEFTTRMWMKPGDKPMESKGTIENTWVYGGRFLKRDFKMDHAGKVMEGTGYSGYDNIRGEYQDLWLGSMSTGLMQSAGKYDAASKTFKFSGTGSCPMTGEKNKLYEGDVKIISNDKYVYTMYDKGPDGKPFKAMEETYTRIKS
jgi:hypothetical protein